MTSTPVPPPFELSFRPDGTLDAAALSQAGVEWLTNWIRNLFEGRDKNFPFDPRSPQSPSELIAAIVRELGQSHPATRDIGAAVLALLDEARQLIGGSPGSSSVAPQFLDSVFRLCERQVLPWVAGWFIEEVKKIADGGRRLKNVRWSLPLALAMLRGAVEQVPAFGSPATLEDWKRLLKIPRYTTLALLALGRDLPARLPYLTTWWQHCAKDERIREMNEMLIEALHENWQDSKSRLHRMGNDLPSALRELVDRVLLDEGVPSAFAAARMPTGPHFGAIAGAGILQSIPEDDDL